ncbi:HupE/UreJ family protein [Xylanimonas protaetiae]|uniref:HupE/UreJ family protein n=1 Tax=Xylanimonas protaetiae TaxID=2509457 RepID=A0A4P6F8M2_9MICO|nr:HupE/UreJ family protein [Xylanimonas protaetiae]QAY69647.1 HupE/UreJ family protein [Xylanimonas protaetiae]
MRAPARLAVVGVLALAALAPAATADAHGFSSTVYADVTSPADGVVRTELSLEYDLLVVSVAEHAHEPAFYDDGIDLVGTGKELGAVEKHADAVARYAGEQFVVTAGGQACQAALTDVPPRMEQREGVPYAVVTLDHTCPAADDHQIASSLFADDEGYVTGTVTVVQYDLDGRSGSAALKPGTPSFHTGQTTWQRFGEFFLLGAEHLLGGIDHILFLLALIVGSRRLREVVLAATSFTVAHSVTFVLAALGLVKAPAAVVEPVIAASIAVVAAWHLVTLWRESRGAGFVHVGALEPARTPWYALDRAGLLRLGVVFVFGLVHGLGFAGALGIDEAFSWRLLWSLLVFNVGIEVVQIGIIAVAFPLLVLLRRRAPRLAAAVGAGVATLVAGMGLIWFVQRLVGA